MKIRKRCKPKEERTRVVALIIVDLNPESSNALKEPACSDDYIQDKLFQVTSLFGAKSIKSDDGLKVYSHYSRGGDSTYYVADTTAFRESIDVWELKGVISVRVTYISSGESIHGNSVFSKKCVDEVCDDFEEIAAQVEFALG